jgi:multiple sugar transport system substrate-binding protein
MFRKLLLAATATFAIATAVSVLPARADTTLKLTEVITSPDRTETLKQIVKSFEDANPGVHVEITSLPWGQAFEKFATMVSAGDTPDVVEMPDRWQSLYANNGMLESLEPYLAKWDHTKDLNDRALQMGRYVNKTAYALPYGFYLRALFYNKKLFAQAGIDGPPKTVDEFVGDAKKVSAIAGKFGYCLRGGPGGLNGWMMFGATMAGDGTFFKPDGASTMADPDWVKGVTVLTDIYKSGAAPKDSVNWGFNDIVSGFYSGTCAMLDQDPDALIGIADHMSKDDYDVAPMPKGPGGKAFPTLGYASWSMFASSQNKDLAWKLISTLDGPDGNIMWNKKTGALPIYKSAEKDPFYADPKFKGWFAELADPNIVPLVMPTYLKEFAFFADSLAVKTTQQALLGQLTPEQLATQWATYLTKAQKKYLAEKK